MKNSWINAELGWLLDYVQPTNYIVKSTAYNDKFKTPVLTPGKTFIKGYTDEVEGIYSNLPTIIFDDFTTASKYVNFPFKVKSSAMKILSPASELVNIKFVFYGMQTLRVRSDTHKRYWISLYSKKKIPLPPLPEQRAIVAKIEQLLSELDNGLTNLKQAKAKLGIYKQAVLKRAFEGEVTREWRRKQSQLPTAEDLINKIEEERLKYYEHQLLEWENSFAKWESTGKKGRKPGKPKKLKAVQPLTEEESKKLSSVPSSWLYNFLSHAGVMGRGKSKHRPRNDKNLFGGKYPFIQTGDVKAQDIITEYSQTYNETGLAQSKLWPKGTMCITIAANIAETGFLGVDACFPDSVVGFTPFTGIINAKYVEYFFRSAKLRIEAYAPATAQKNINLTTLENLVIPFCSMEEQNQIVQELDSRLSVCEKLVTDIDEDLQRSEALRQSILKKAFEGKLLSEQELNSCRKEPDWEPAEKLLERIKNKEKEPKVAEEV